MSKPRVTRIVHVIQVGSASIAKGWGLSKDVIDAKHKDGRAASPMTEKLAAKIYNLREAASSCQPGFDADEGTGSETPKTEFKCLTHNGVKFQRSARIGTGRDKNKKGESLTAKQKKNQLIADVGRVESYVVTDVTEFPTIRMTRVASGFVAGLVGGGKLGASGISKVDFYEALLEKDDEGLPTCEVSEVQHNLDSTETSI